MNTKKILECYLPQYLEILKRYLLAENPREREAALFETNLLGRDLLQEGFAPDEMLDIHLRAVQTLSYQDLLREGYLGNCNEHFSKYDTSLLLFELIMAHGIAYRAEMEQRWEEEHSKLVAIFEQTGDFVVVTNEKAEIQYVNPAFTNFTGWALEDVRGKTPSIWHSGKQSSGFYHDLWNKIKHLKTWHGHLINLKKDGTPYYEELSISPVVSRDGKTVNYMGIGRDVTRQKILEQNLHEADRLRSVAILASGIAHDFNNLLGSIMGLADICQIQVPGESKVGQNLAKIVDVSYKARVLVRQMLDFSRQNPLDIQVIKVSELLHMSEGLMRANLISGILFRTEVTPEAQNESISIDITRMEQVLYNLCNNAIDAIHGKGGILTIRADIKSPLNVPEELHATHGYVCLQVIDTGEGIPQEIRDKIFDPFFTTKAVGKGTGLGLASVHGIIAQHGGTIEVESEVAQGTTFSVFLPRYYVS